MNSLRDQTRWKVIKEDDEYCIRGKRGQIAMYLDGSINLWVLNNRIVNKIKWKPLHTYDDGADYKLNIDDLDEACGHIKARKRRHMSPEQRQKNAERLATMRSNVKKDSEEGSKSNEDPQNA